MKKIISIIILVFLIIGMIVPFISAINETNATNETINITYTEPEFLQIYQNEEIKIDWLVLTETGIDIINFENKEKLQIQNIYFVSGSTHYINIECKSHNEDNSLCYYLKFKQNILIEETKDIMQIYDVSLLLIDDAKYTSELIFTDENKIKSKIIIRALSKDEFGFDGTTTILGITFLTSTLSLIIAFIISISILVSSKVTLLRTFLLFILMFPISFGIYMFMSLL